MNIRLVPVTTGERLEQIRHLYESAFPPEERKPFSLLVEKCHEGNVDILCAENDAGEMLGEAILVRREDIILLAYFAMAESFRGQGGGTFILQQLQKRYKGKRFVLEIESTKAPSADLQMRRRRKQFYLRNGLKVMDFSVLYYGVELEILTYECEVSYEEYHDVYGGVFGEAVAAEITRLP